MMHQTHKLWLGAVNDVPFKLSLTVSAKLGTVDLSWYNLPTPNVGYILLTDTEPTAPFHIHELRPIEPHSIDTDVARQQPQQQQAQEQTRKQNLNRIRFTYGFGNASALYWVRPSDRNGWEASSVIFDSNLLKSITKHTKCYGYWAIYLNDALDVVQPGTCMRAYGTWMNDERDHVKHFRFRDLFIVGTHDSASYRMNFNATRNDTLVTKYALTQVNNERTRYA